MGVYIKNLGEISGSYDAFILDIFGVLHNGLASSRSCIDCLQRLTALEKQVILISNSPLASACVMEDLAAFGISPAFYQYIITAGDMARTALLERNDAFHARLGDYCYLIGTSRQGEILKGTGIHKVHTLNEASFILNCGTDEWHPNLEYYKEILDRGIELGLPMICANPDRQVFVGNQAEIRAGELAEYYITRSGKCFFHGKPHSRIYQKAMEWIGPTDTHRILAIGDSFLTDLAGAHQMNMDFMLVLGLLGAHELDINLSCFSPENPEKIQYKIMQCGYNPRYVTFENLVW